MREGLTDMGTWASLSDPVGLALVVLLVLTIAACLAVVLWRDIRHFEIHFEALGAACLATLALILLTAGADPAIEALTLAALIGTLTEVLRRFRPGRIGAGDPWAFAALGLMCGPGHAIVALLTAATLSLAASIGYARARGKRLFRSMFPAAVALVPTMALALALRLLDATGALPPVLDRLAVPLSPDTMSAIALITPALFFGLWLGGRKDIKRPEPIIIRRRGYE